MRRGGSAFEEVVGIRGLYSQPTENIVVAEEGKSLRRVELRHRRDFRGSEDRRVVVA
jgi:hypothetical protein